MTVFSAALAACGLSLHEAARVLGQSHSTVEKKSRGVLAMTRADTKRLREFYGHVRAGTLDGLPDSVRDAAAALRILRGAEDVPIRRPGRKPAAD